EQLPYPLLGPAEHILELHVGASTIRAGGLGDIWPGVEPLRQLVEAAVELAYPSLEQSLQFLQPVLEPVARLLHLAQSVDQDVLELALADDVGPEQPQQDPAPEDADPACARGRVPRDARALGQVAGRLAGRRLPRCSLDPKAFQLRHPLGQERSGALERLAPLDGVLASKAPYARIFGAVDHLSENSCGFVQVRVRPDRPGRIGPDGVLQRGE